MWSDTRFEAILRGRLERVGADEPLPMDLPLLDMGLGSMESVQLLLDLEEEFGTELPDRLVSKETFSTALTLREAFLRCVPR